MKNAAFFKSMLLFKALVMSNTVLVGAVSSSGGLDHRPPLTELVISVGGQSRHELDVGRSEPLEYPELRGP